MAKPKGGLSRCHALAVPVTWMERKQVEEDAKRSKLSTTDYVRLKLGLPTIADSEGEKTSAGDPDNAVDVEELAKEILAKYGNPANVIAPKTMAEARREAKRRLREAAGA